MHDLGLLAHQKFGDGWRPCAVFDGSGADGGALGEVFVAPHVHELVERADFGFPERSEFGIFFALLVFFTETFFDFGHGARLDGIGSDFVNHGESLFRIEDLEFRIE